MSDRWKTELFPKYSKKIKEFNKPKSPESIGEVRAKKLMQEIFKPRDKPKALDIRKLSDQIGII